MYTNSIETNLTYEVADPDWKVSKTAHTDSMKMELLTAIEDDFILRMVRKSPVFPQLILEYLLKIIIFFAKTQLQFFNSN